MNSWYCNICDKTMNIKSKSKHIIYKSRKHKEKCSVVVKERKFIRPDNNKIHFINKNCAKDCYYNYFQRLNFRCINDIEMTNGDFANGIFSDKMLKNIDQENCFIHKLTVEFYSNLSNIKIW